MTLVHQIVRQPGNFEIQHVVCPEQATARPPHRSLCQYFEKPFSALLRGRNGSASPRHPREPRNQPGHAEHSENDEEGPPSVSCHERPSKKCTQGWATPDSCGDERVCEPTANFRNMPY